MAGTTPDFNELMRRAQLQRQFENLSGAGQQDQNAQVMPVSNQVPQAQTTQNSPYQISPRDVAMSEYRQALEQPAPNIADYHPSVGRRITAGILGALAGAHNAQSGVETARSIVNAPFNKQLTSYQQRLEGKKQAAEMEEKQAEGEAKIGELSEQKKAESARAEAEVERGKTQVKARDAWKPTSKEEALELEQAKREPVQKEPKNPIPHIIELKNGEKVNGLQMPDGSYIDPNTNTKIGLDAIKTAYPLESKEAPKPEKPETTPKVGTPFEAKISDYVNTHGKAPSGKDLDDIIRQTSQLSQTPELAAARAGQATRDVNAPGQASYNRHAAVLDKDFKTIDTAMQKWNNVEELLKQNSAQSDALIVPQLLSATVGGQNSGFRMTEAEMARTAGGRTIWESIKANANKWAADPQHAQIPSDQRQAIHNIASALEKHVKARQGAVIEADKALANSNDPMEHRKIMTNYQQKLADIDSGVFDASTSKKPDDAEFLKKLLGK